MRNRFRPWGAHAPEREELRRERRKIIAACRQGDYRDFSVLREFLYSMPRRRGWKVTEAEYKQWEQGYAALQSASRTEPRENK
jgi:hypothetical protein